LKKLKLNILSKLVITACIGLFAINSSFAREREVVSIPQTEAEFEALMPVSGKVETFFGDFDLEYSTLTKESGDKLYKIIDHQRASQLYLWGLPIVAMEGFEQNSFRNFKNYHYNAFIQIETFNERRGYLTANETTNYVIANINTRKSAVIVKLPPGAIVGMIVDMWEQSPTDIGIYGPESGKGATFVIVGPNTPQEMIPEPQGVFDDFRIVNIDTDRGGILMRVLGTKKEVDATWAKLKVYSYGEEPGVTVLDGEDKFAPTYQPRGIAYWEMLHTAIQNEPVQERDRFFMYWLKTLGIEKGKPFNPNEYQKGVLLDGAKLGELMAKNLVFNERLEGVLRQNDWRYVLGGAWGQGIKGNQSQKYYDIFDPRARYTYEAQMTSPAMTIPRAGTSQGYLGKFEDENNEPLKGDQMYVIKVSGPIPAKLFWSFTVYDNQTRVLLDNSATGGDVTVDSTDPKVKFNKDGSFYILLGPGAAPKGWESNYIRTLPKRGWFTYLRAYGAEKAFFDDSYKLPTVTKVKSFDAYIK
jgi:hypothetical protein